MKGLFRVTLCLCFETSKRVFVEDLSYEKKFDLRENKPARGIDFYPMKGFAIKLVLT